MDLQCRSLTERVEIVSENRFKIQGKVTGKNILHTHAQGTAESEHAHSLGTAYLIPSSVNSGIY
jgi:hypothetical protein